MVVVVQMLEGEGGAAGEVVEAGGEGGAGEGEAFGCGDGGGGGGVAAAELV